MLASFKRSADFFASLTPSLCKSTSTHPVKIFSEFQTLLPCLIRINIDDEGNHWLIDYKTGTHEGGGIEDFIKEEIKRYRTQLEKYAEIYEAYSNIKPIVRLYYPNLSQLIEIDRLN